MTRVVRPNVRRTGPALGVAAAVVSIGLAGSLGSPAAAGGADAAAKTGVLEAASMLSESDGWAVGSSGSTGSKPLAERWNGTSWKAVSIENPGKFASLHGVSAVASDDVWTAGAYAKGDLKTLVEHWNGSSWSQMHTDSPGNALNELTSISADSPSDAWAAGATRMSGAASKTLVEHYDGTAWQRVAAANPGDAKTESRLNAVKALSPSDVWATGSFTPSGESEMPLAEHWNGVTWTISSLPSPEGSLTTTLSGIDAAGPHDVWAVGSYQLVGSPEQTLVEHWDGSAWAIVSSPNGSGNSASTLTGVSVVSATDAWASGSTVKGANTTPLLAHWDGTDWTQVAAENAPSSTRTMPVAISVPSTADGWFVGGYSSRRGALKPLFEHWDGSAWKIG